MMEGSGASKKIDNVVWMPSHSAKLEAMIEKVKTHSAIADENSPRHPAWTSRIKDPDKYPASPTFPS